MKKNAAVNVILLLAVVAVGVLAGILFLQRNEARKALADWEQRNANWEQRNAMLVGIVDDQKELKAAVPEDCSLVWDDDHERTLFDGQLGFGEAVPFVSAVERDPDSPDLRRVWSTGRKNYIDASAFDCDASQPAREHLSTQTSIRRVEHFHGVEGVGVYIASWVCESNPGWVIQYCSPLEGGGARVMLSHPLGMLVLILVPDDQPEHYVLHHFLYLGVGAKEAWVAEQMAR